MFSHSLQMPFHKNAAKTELRCLLGNMFFHLSMELVTTELLKESLTTSVRVCVCVLLRTGDELAVSLSYFGER